MFTCGGPSCATAIVVPAIVNDPVRAAPGLAVTDTVTLPLSFPAAPAVTAINASLLRAVHAHPTAFEVTVIVAVPPDDANERLDGVTVNVQAGATGESLLQADAAMTRHKAPAAESKRSKDMGAAACNG
jgi:hypothetical protein